MRRLFLAFSALTLSVSPVLATGINLGWNDCPSGGTYAEVERFACDTNVGLHTLVASFVAPAGIEKMSANEITIDALADAPSLPSWWSFGSGQCRPTSSLIGDFDFTHGPFSCFDYWQGGAAGSLNSTFTYGNRFRINGVFALPAGDARITSVPEDLEVYSFKCDIDNARSTGLGACGGCSSEVCLALTALTIDQPAPYPQMLITNPAASAWVIWQGWQTIDPDYLCPYPATPARKRTWGSIKALYR